MAQILPLIMAIGGSAGAATGGAGILSTLSAGAGALGAIGSIAQGFAAQDKAELAARTEEVNGRRAAASVQEDLIKGQAMNNAAAAASGLASSGSVARAQEVSRRKAEDELSINRFNTEQRARQQRSRGKQAMVSGLLEGASGLISSGQQFAARKKAIKGT